MSSTAISANSGTTSVQHSATQGSDPVDHVVDSIKTNMSIASTGWEDTQVNVQTIVETLEELDADQTRAVLDELSTHGTLDALAQKTVDDRTTGLGSLSSAE